MLLSRSLNGQRLAEAGTVLNHFSSKFLKRQIRSKKDVINVSQKNDEDD
jgi:hypothetical protein